MDDTESQTSEIRISNVHASESTGLDAAGNKSLVGRGVYDYNPIVNYFFYNHGTEAKTLTQRLVEVDDYTREMFTKHQLRVCTVGMSNCFASGPFKDIDHRKMPLKVP